MEATNPQANAQLVSCHTSEMQGERIVKVGYGHPAHKQFNLLGAPIKNPYASLTYTMASGKVFVVTSSGNEVNCYRSSVDEEPVNDIVERIEALEHEAARMRDEDKLAQLRVGDTIQDVFLLAYVMQNDIGTDVRAKDDPTTRFFTH